MRPLVSALAALAVLFGILGPLANEAPAQDGEDSAARSKILALEHAWNQAEAAHDLKSLDALFDTALVYVDSDGTLMTKAVFLAHAKDAPVQQVVTEEMAVQIHDNTAIVTGIYRANEFHNGKLRIYRGRFVDTWVLKNHMWVCVAAQATPISN